MSRLQPSLPSAELRIVLLVFALVSAFVFALQPRNSGFASDIHDFVSSHTLTVPRSLT
jgi:hypothetical protein